MKQELFFAIYAITKKFLIWPLVELKFHLQYKLNIIYAEANYFFAIKLYNQLLT
jgi:hypothetical protein